MLLELKKEITYGPVASRRLGRSLGINLLSGKEKICSFNCLYCQYGWTDYESLKDAVFPAVDEVVSAVEKALLSLEQPPDFITFSGNGEPTLHPHFPKLVKSINQLRDDLTPQAETAILSNASTVSDSVIKEALARLDVRIMKLDAARSNMFKMYNGAHPGLFLDEIVEGLSTLDNVTIQTLFTKGPKGNSSTKHVSEWIQKLEQINPIDVHIYSLDRGYPSQEIECLSKEDLIAIESRTEEHGLPVRMFFRE